MCTLMRELRNNQEITSSGLRLADFESTIDGQPTALYVLKNRQGAEVCITNYGARIASLLVPDKDGGMTDVVLGFDNVDSYHSLRQNFGATVGRYIGRITGARYVLDGEEVRLQGFGVKDISHGGYPGFADRVWKVTGQQPQSLTLQYLSPDGENGFPGNLTLTLTLTLTDDNALRLDYEATTDKPTVINPSNHSFFNISGEPWKTVTNEQLWVNSDSIAEYSPKKQVTGRLIPTAGTPFHFKTMHPIGDRIDEDNQQLNVTGGYDHAWKLNTRGNIALPAAKLFDSTSGIQLTVYTTEPAVHIYTANGLKGNVQGKGGIGYPKRSAICFETCHFADSPNQPQFPSTTLRPGEKFHSTTIFQFSNEKP
ncbi:MAG: galactose mutarotase [Prevotella sp.]|nr:galactose mutarotase [Prevotella sp.]MBR1462381.1 galactose mutarotase [Prevotella sp.]